jgi:predicted small lipoprotein YifL
MREKNFYLLLVIILFLIIPVALLGPLKSPPADKITKSSPPIVKGVEEKTTVEAFVHEDQENYWYLSGYSSPLAQIYLSSSVGNIKDKTTADETGFFRFQFALLPQKTGELCLITEDLDGLASPPLYLPEPPANKNVEIEDVLMPPTVSISKGKVSLNEMNAAIGKTFPNAKVSVYLYSDPQISFWSKIKNLILREVWAKTAPRLEVESDSSGNFEFNLPSGEPADQNLFVASLLYGNYSPKSFTLSFSTSSLGDKILLILWSILNQIYLFLESIIEDPTKVIWLEIPILILLFLKVLLRGWLEKIANEE